MTGPVETIARGGGSRIVRPQQSVARSESEWRALWAAHAGPDAEAPEVDFDSRMVAAVFAGENGGARGITIAGTSRDGVVLLLLVESAPSDGAPGAETAASWFHIVTLPRYEGEIAFVGAGDRRAHAVRGADPRGRHHEPAPSSTGLAPHVAGALAYVAGPLSGALLLAVEGTSRFVKFHAWQALLALGTLAAAAAFFLALAFLLLIVSAAAFWTMLWLAAGTAVVWVALWLLCIIQAYNGRIWKLPLAGGSAERRAGLAR